MKRRFYHMNVAVLLMLLPLLTTAQWSMVRFDEFNYFTEIATINPNAAVSMGLITQGSGSFVMRTNDGGITWDSLLLNIPGSSYMISGIHFTDINNGFAGGVSNNQQALIKTSDNGTTWAAVTPDPSSPYPINGISFTDPLNGFAADDISVYKTTDGGITWLTYIPGMTIRDIGFADMNIGYASGAIAPDAVVMKTTDGGQSWNTVLTATLPFFTTSSMQKSDVVNQDVVFISGQYSNIIFKTVDGGVSWDTITVSQIYDIVDFDFTSANEGHLVSSMGEIFNTIDGGQNWTLEYAVASGAYGPSVLLTSISFVGNSGYVCGTSGLIKKHADAVGLTEQTGNSSFSIYPNPVSADQTLKIVFPQPEFIMEMFNASGMLVRKELSQTSLSLSGLPPGVYSVRVTGNDEVAFGKVVLMR